MLVRMLPEPPESTRMAELDALIAAEGKPKPGPKPPTCRPAWKLTGVVQQNHKTCEGPSHRSPRKSGQR